MNKQAQRSRVTKLDRLGRSTRELLDDPLWDTTSSQGRLLSTLLAVNAEFERGVDPEAYWRGRKRAMTKVRFGRKPKLTPHQRQEAIARRDAGKS